MTHPNDRSTDTTQAEIAAHGSQDGSQRVTPEYAQNNGMTDAYGDNPTTHASMYRSGYDQGLSDARKEEGMRGQVENESNIMNQRSDGGPFGGSPDNGPFGGSPGAESLMAKPGTDNSFTPNSGSPFGTSPKFDTSERHVSTTEHNEMPSYAGGSYDNPLDTPDLTANPTYTSADGVVSQRMHDHPTDPIDPATGAPSLGTAGNFAIGTAGIAAGAAVDRVNTKRAAANASPEQIRDAAQYNAQRGHSEYNRYLDSRQDRKLADEMAKGRQVAHQENQARLLEEGTNDAKNDGINDRANDKKTSSSSDSADKRDTPDRDSKKGKGRGFGKGKGGARAAAKRGAVNAGKAGGRVAKKGATRAAASVAGRLGARAGLMAAGAAVPGPGWAVAAGVAATVVLEAAFNPGFRSWVAGLVRSGGIAVDTPPEPPYTYWLPHIEKDKRAEVVNAVDGTLHDLNKQITGVENPDEFKMWDVTGENQVPALTKMLPVTDHINHVALQLNTFSENMQSLMTGSESNIMASYAEALQPSLNTIATFNEQAGKPLNDSIMEASQLADDAYQLLLDANLKSRETLAKSSGDWLRVIPHSSVEEGDLVTNHDDIINKIEELRNRQRKITDSVNAWVTELAPGEIDKKSQDHLVITDQKSANPEQDGVDSDEPKPNPDNTTRNPVAPSNSPGPTGPTGPQGGPFASPGPVSSPGARPSTGSSPFASPDSGDGSGGAPSPSGSPFGDDDMSSDDSKDISESGSPFGDDKDEDGGLFGDDGGVFGDDGDTDSLMDGETAGGDPFDTSEGGLFGDDGDTAGSDMPGVDGDTGSVFGDYGTDPSTAGDTGFGTDDGTELGIDDGSGVFGDDGTTSSAFDPSSTDSESSGGLGEFGSTGFDEEGNPISRGDSTGLTGGTSSAFDPGSELDDLFGEESGADGTGSSFDPEAELAGDTKADEDAGDPFGSTTEDYDPFGSDGDSAGGGGPAGGGGGSAFDGGGGGAFGGGGGAGGGAGETPGVGGDDVFGDAGGNGAAGGEGAAGGDGAGEAGDMPGEGADAGEGDGPEEGGGIFDDMYDENGELKDPETRAAGLGMTGEEAREAVTVDVHGEERQFLNPETAELANKILDPAVDTTNIPFDELAEQSGITMPESGDAGVPISPAEAQPGDVMTADGKDWLYVGEGQVIDPANGEVANVSDLAGGGFAGEGDGFFRMDTDDGGVLDQAVGGTVDGTAPSVDAGSVDGGDAAADGAGAADATEAPAPGDAATGASTTAPAPGDAGTDATSTPMPESGDGAVTDAPDAAGTGSGSGSGDAAATPAPDSSGDAAGSSDGDTDSAGDAAGSGSSDGGDAAGGSTGETGDYQRTAEAPIGMGAGQNVPMDTGDNPVEGGGASAGGVEAGEGGSYAQGAQAATDTSADSSGPRETAFEGQALDGSPTTNTSGAGEVPNTGDALDPNSVI